MWQIAECAECKDKNGPWILENNIFLCEDCYEKLRALSSCRSSILRSPEACEHKLGAAPARQNKKHISRNTEERRT